MAVIYEMSTITLVTDFRSIYDDLGAIKTVLVPTKNPEADICKISLFFPYVPDPGFQFQFRHMFRIPVYEVCLLNTCKGSVAGAPLTGKVW
jgi:hypothetical protein